MNLLPSMRLAVLISLGIVPGLTALFMPGAVSLLLLFDLLILLLAVIDLVAATSPSRVIVEATAPDRAVHTRTLVCQYRASTEKGEGLCLFVKDALPPGLEAGDRVFELILPPGETGGAARELYCGRRGEFKIPECTARWFSPMKLWQRQKRFDVDLKVRVLPRLKEVERFALRHGADLLRRQGIEKVRHRGMATEFESLKEFQPGDDRRHIDWKATARLGQLLVRQYEIERNKDVFLLLDGGRLMAAPCEGVTKLDRGIDLALILAHVCLVQGDRVGLLSYAAEPQKYVPPRGSYGHLHLLRDTLADFQVKNQESDHAGALRFLSAKQGKRALVVIITDFIDTLSVERSLPHLSFQLKRHRCVFLALEEEALRLRLHPPPDDVKTAMEASVAAGLMLERQRLMEQLRHMGIFALSGLPGELTVPLINHYLMLKKENLL